MYSSIENNSLDITTILLSRGSKYDKMYCDQSENEIKEEEIKNSMKEIELETTEKFKNTFNPNLDITG